MFHLVSPALTARKDSQAAEFVESVERNLKCLAVPVQWLNDWTDAEAALIGEGEGVVYVNPPGGGRHPQRAVAWLGSLGGKVVIFPIAMDRDSRRPPEPASELNVYDLTAARRRLGNDPAQIAVAANEFTYEAMAAVQPSLGHHRLKLFVSYRRQDGEPLAWDLKRQMEQRRLYRSFLDLDDIAAGADFMKVLDRELAGCDVLILLDTPSVADSTWVGREVLTALVRHVPVVWVRIGPAPDDDQRYRRYLPIPPANTPAVIIEDADASALPEGCVTEILETAHRLMHEHARRALSILRSTQRSAEARGFSVKPLDLRRSIYEFRESECLTPLPRRPRTDIVQIFGRHPTNEDRDELISWLAERRMGPHEEIACRAYDAAVLLDPMPVSASSGSGDNTVVAHGYSYGEWIGVTAEEGSERQQDYANGGAPQPSELLLLSAFPADASAQGKVVAAVRAVVGVWLLYGGTVSFGGHPTVTPLVIELARKLASERGGPAVRVYQSEWFPPNDKVAAVDAFVEVVRTPRMEDRAGSLTEMRRLMVSHSRARAVVLIGGRTDEQGTHEPGVDEELALAREAGLPCFILGAAGGRGADIAALQAERDWSGLGNTLGPENERLQYEDDYEDLARIIWNNTSTGTK